MPSLSPDRRHYWNGQAWMPVPPARDSATWWSDAPDWMGPVALNGLTLLVPVIGHMVVLGWVLAARDELQAGRNLVPPATFAYLSRGWRPWLAQLIWGLYAMVVWIVLGAALGVFVALGTNGGAWAVIAVVAVVLAVLLFVATIVIMLALVVPVLAIAGDVGVLAALNPVYVMQVIRAHPVETRRGAVIQFVGTLVAVFGGLLLSCLLVANVFATAATLLSLAAPLARVRLTVPPASP